MAGRHSEPVRGLMATKTSPIFQGRFGRMFRSLHAARFGKDDADTLANADSKPASSESAEPHFIGGLHRTLWL